jgi:hypothetical protein
VGSVIVDRFYVTNMRETDRASQYRDVGSVIVDRLYANPLATSRMDETSRTHSWDPKVSNTAATPLVGIVVQDAGMPRNRRHEISNNVSPPLTIGFGIEFIVFHFTIGLNGKVQRRQEARFHGIMGRVTTYTLIQTGAMLFLIASRRWVNPILYIVSTMRITLAEKVYRSGLEAKDVDAQAPKWCEKLVSRT